MASETIFGDIAHRQFELMQQLPNVIAWCQKTRAQSRLLRADFQKILEQSRRPVIGGPQFRNRWPQAGPASGV
jgi:hypothetical protein